jgi:hypothetical protein
MNEKLETADTNTRKGYIQSIIDAIEVDDKAIRIIGSRISSRPPSPANRSRTGMFVVLYAPPSLGDESSIFDDVESIEHQVGRPKPSEGGGMRETPPHVSYDILCLSSSQEID